MVHADYQEMIGGKKVKPMQEGRICKYKGCKVILSIYNKEKYCSMHKSKMMLNGKRVGKKHSHLCHYNEE